MQSTPSLGAAAMQSTPSLGAAAMQSTPPLGTAFAFASAFASAPRALPAAAAAAAGAAEAAGARRGVRACAATPPTDVDGTVRLASASLDAALRGGHRRARVAALIPGLNPLVEETFAFSSSTLNTLALHTALATPTLREAPRCALLFESAGAAAAAATQFRRAREALPDTLYVSTFDAPDQFANVLVAPRAVRGDAVLPVLEAAVRAAPRALWVMLNDQLRGDGAAVGVRHSARRDAFERSFVLAFYFRNLFLVRRPSLQADEKGALMFRYGRDWRAFALQSGRRYALVGEWAQRPDASLVARLVERSLDAAATAAADDDDGGSGGGGGDAAADARFLQLVVLGGALAAALSAALQLRQP